MPQTVEAINHAKAADIPVVVAVNKIDKPALRIKVVEFLAQPTNDLDIDTLQELESLLDSWPGTMVVNSHHRYHVQRNPDTTDARGGAANRTGGCFWWLLQCPWSVPQFLH